MSLISAGSISLDSTFKSYISKRMSSNCKTRRGCKNAIFYQQTIIFIRQSSTQRIQGSFFQSKGGGGLKDLAVWFELVTQGTR